jgi:transposase
MNGDRMAMGQGEGDRLKMMACVLDGERTLGEAARLLGLSVRQVRRIKRRLKREGDPGIMHRLRGRPSSRRKPDTMQDSVLCAYRERYPDFGPTFAAAKLAEEDLIVSAETLRRWLRAEGPWQVH